MGADMGIWVSFRVMEGPDPQNRPILTALSSYLALDSHHKNYLGPGQTTDELFESLLPTLSSQWKPQNPKATAPTKLLQKSYRNRRF
jgi:hypothetical protein